MLATFFIVLVAFVAFHFCRGFFSCMWADLKREKLPQQKMKATLYFHGGPLDGVVMNYESNLKPSALYPFPPTTMQFPGSPVYGLCREIDGGYLYEFGSTVLREAHFKKIFGDGGDKPKGTLSDEDSH